MKKLLLAAIFLLLTNFGWAEQKFVCIRIEMMIDGWNQTYLSINESSELKKLIKQGWIIKSITGAGHGSRTNYAFFGILLERPDNYIEK